MHDCRDRRGSLLSNTASESSRSDLVTRSSRSRIEFEGSTNFSSVHHLSKSYYKFVSENKEISKLVSVLSTAINSTKKVSSTILYNFPDHCFHFRYVVPRSSSGLDSIGSWLSFCFFNNKMALSVNTGEFRSLGSTRRPLGNGVHSNQSVCHQLFSYGLVVTLSQYISLRSDIWVQVLCSTPIFFIRLLIILLNRKECLAIVVASTWTKSVTSLHFFLRLSWDQYTQVGLSLPLAENRIKLSFSLRERFLFVVLNSRAYIV